MTWYVLKDRTLEERIEVLGEKLEYETIRHIPESVEWIAWGDACGLLADDILNDRATRPRSLRAKLAAIKGRL